MWIDRHFNGRQPSGLINLSISTAGWGAYAWDKNTSADFAPKMQGGMYLQDTTVIQVMVVM